MNTAVWELTLYCLVQETGNPLKPRSQALEPFFEYHQDLVEGWEAAQNYSFVRGQIMAFFSRVPTSC